MKQTMKLVRQDSPASKHRAIKALVAAGLFTGLMTIFLVPPADFPFATCAFRSITGHSCLTCGMTRSLHAISHGHLMASLQYHLLGPIVFIGVVLTFLIFAIEGIFGKVLALRPNRNQIIHFIVPIAVIWFLYWGARLITEL